MDLERTVGLRQDGAIWLPERRAAVSSILLKLAAMGVRIPPETGDEDVLNLAGDLFARYREQTRLLSEHLCPADRRIQEYIDGLLRLAAFSGPVRSAERDAHPRSLRARARAVAADRRRLVAERAGLELSPRQRRAPQSRQRSPHDPGRLPRRGGRSADPRRQDRACRSPPISTCCGRRCSPPAELTRLPFTASWPEPVETMVSLLLRPLVCPAVPKVQPEKRLEMRFFVPGGLVSNLDFVESIFGNAGDPYLPGNDAGLDVDHWTGHSGCVILAPHLTRLRKKDVGLPHVSQASEVERAAGMCWTDEGRAVQRGPALQDHLARHGRRDGDDPGRQLFRLLQEGSEDPDRLQRQSLRHGRRGARGGRAGLRDVQSGRPVRAGPGENRERQSPLRARCSHCWAGARSITTRATPPTRSTPRSTTCPRTWRSTSSARTSSG